MEDRFQQRKTDKQAADISSLLTRYKMSLVLILLSIVSSARDSSVVSSVTVSYFVVFPETLKEEVDVIDDRDDGAAACTEEHRTGGK